MRSFIIILGFLSSSFATVLEKKSDLEVSDSNKLLNESEPHPTTTEVSALPCPPTKSLHTQKDINTIIDYRVKTLSVYNSINSSYYSKAVAVRNKHINDFTNFRSWYKNRPEHLKHNIADIAFLRGHIEPFVKHVAEALNQYPQLQEIYKIKLNQTNSLIGKLNRYKIICENNCEHNANGLSAATFRLSRRMNYNGYYCSSLEELDRNVQSKLLDLAKNVSSTMINRVSYDDKEYAKKIENLKNKLKDAALIEFGRTMYDILSLQDEYHHFIEDLKNFDAHAEVYKIKETNLQIDIKLLELEQRTGKYGSYCVTCNKISLRSMPLKVHKRITLQDEESVSTNLVNYLLNLKFKEIKNSTDNEYNSIFKELKSLLKNTDSKEIYLKDLKPIQDEVLELLKKLKESFDELKSIASPSAVKRVVKLSDDSKDLLTRINKELDYLNKVWPK